MMVTLLVRLISYSKAKVSDAKNALLHYVCEVHTNGFHGFIKKHQCDHLCTVITCTLSTASQT
jgi:hypothetical protein